MANKNTKIINIARLSPISTLDPSNTKNNINGKAVADFIDLKLAELKQYVEENFLRGSVVTQKTLPPEEDRKENHNYFVIGENGYVPPPSPPEPEPEETGEMILNISILSNNFELNLFDYVGGSDVDDAIIDWGDNSKNVEIDSSTSSLSHTYSTAGDYQLKIKGQIKWKGKSQSSATFSLSKCLISIELPTNNSPIVDIGIYGFSRFTKLTSIPVGLFDKCIEVTSFMTCFYFCSQLQSIPEHLFDNCTKVTSFYACFFGCKQLQSIPKGLFDNCTKVTSFDDCFRNCSKLQSIPEGLFDNCVEATSFIACFVSCSQLQSIPEGLFDNCTEVIDFRACFQNCEQLQSIPERLFDNCTKVTSFNNCFYNCSSVTSKLPTLWISHPSADGNRCFFECNKAPNYTEAYAARWV